jgi:lysophospholipase L1-like esterase
MNVSRPASPDATLPSRPPRPSSGAAPARAHGLLGTTLLFLVSVVVALALGEGVLRLLGFTYELRLHMIESTAPNPTETVRNFRIDRDLAWVPGDYDSTLRQAAATHPPLIFMGDSCTQLGWYDEYFERYATADHPGEHVRTANFGCAGYTTHQGLRQLRRDVVPLHPRVVTFYYGWNDHWLSIGIDDEEVSRLNASPLFRFNELRLVQLANKVSVKLRLRRRGQLPVRVSPEQFRNNLLQMVRTAREAGIVPVLVTAPTSHEIGHEPAYLAGRWVANLADLVPLHRRYVGIVREVAQTENVPLCDLAAEFDALPRDEVRTAFFNTDGIHLTDDGNRAVAAGLLSFLDHQGLLDRLLEK